MECGVSAARLAEGQTRANAVTPCALAAVYVRRANHWLLLALSYEAARTDEATVQQRRAFYFLESKAREQARINHLRLFKTGSDCR